MPRSRIAQVVVTLPFILLGTIGLVSALTLANALAEDDDERGLELIPPAAEAFEAGRKWAVIIGINEYLDEEHIPALAYCVADARLMFKQLVEKCGYDEGHVILLTDDQKSPHLRPQLVNIEKQLRGTLSKAKEGDTVLVYFAGHGDLDDRGQGFLIPQDCKKKNFGLTALRTEQLKDLLHQSKASQKLLVLDCCHAGTHRGDTDPGPSAEELGAAFKSARGLITLASCMKRERSREWKEKGQGLFTYFLAQGLGGAADYDHDGIVDSSELYRYLSDKVPLAAQRAGGEQTPVEIKDEDTTGVFALARIRADLSRRVTTRPRVNDEEITNSIGMKFVPIPAGTFRMGAPRSERLKAAFADDLNADQKPQHKVQITRAFYLGKFTVTRGEFRKFVEDTDYQTEAEKAEKPSTWKEDESCPQTDKHPVINVSWNDAMAFCDWLSKKENKKYRLPTEAEWEYSCRAGTTTRYHSGDDVEGAREVAWSGKGEDESMMSTSPVGRLDPNAWGLHDMHGNVSQWCQDFYDAEYYDKGEDRDPTGPSDGTSRVVRGGNYLELPDDPPKDKADDPPKDKGVGGGFGGGFGLGGLLPGSWRPSTSARREEREPAETDSLLGFRMLREQ